MVCNNVSKGKELSSKAAPLEPRTLRDVLSALGQYGRYAGLSIGTDLSETSLDKKLSIRSVASYLDHVYLCL